MSLSAQDREILWSGIRRARHEDAPVPLAHEANADHVLWAVTPAVEVIVARHVATALGSAAAEIESDFQTWDSLGNGPRAPHPIHSEAWLVQRCYAICAAIVRAQIHN